MRLKAPEEPVDRKVRDELVLAHVGLVKIIASRLERRLPSQVETAELISVGVLGLIEAASRYRPSTGVPFDAFARRRIHGAMLDALRGMDWVPRSLRKQQRELDGTIADLRHALGREPEGSEIASALNLSEADYESMLEDLRMAELASIRQTDTEGSASGFLEIAIEAEAEQYTKVERSELRACLARAIGELPERDRQILALYYEEELTLAEIGRVIGVGESRVSQLRSQAIARLRATLREWLAPLEARAS
jgi:RNA polymerase sigma factor for flagellar operon FliA